MCLRLSFSFIPTPCRRRRTTWATAAARAVLEVMEAEDVPGRALRLIVFDRVPWARPDIRHRARREIFGGRAYDDMLTRLKLKQAYGRLIRRRDDKGVFVVLDPAMPSRLTGAFPPGVAVAV